MKLTKRQGEAWELLESKAMHIFLYGGTRSGKTLVLLLFIIKSCIENTGLWTMIARLKYNHAKSSIWKQSLLQLLKKIGLTEGEDYKVNKSDLEIEFFNGSKIIVTGLDSEDRIEKVLGHEYGIIYLNEISQISYDIVVNVRPRLAQKIKGFRNKMLYDCNPPSPKHWAHQEFIEFINPKTKKKLNKSNYVSLRMNPADNKKHLPRTIFKMLEELPEKEKKRYLYGEWVRPEGMIYSLFDESMIIDKYPAGWNKHIFAGVDFGLNMAIVFVTEIGGVYYVLSDYGAFGSTSSQFNRNAKRVMEWDIAYCDPSGGERIQEIDYGTKADNSVEDGIDFILDLMNTGRFKVHQDALGVLSEIYDYRRDEKGRIIKENDHYLDAMRYAIFTHHKTVGERHSIKDIILGKGNNLLRI